MTVMLDFDQHPHAIVWRAGSPVNVSLEENRVRIDIPFRPFALTEGLQPLEDSAPEVIPVYLELWGDAVVRLTTNPGIPLSSPMLEIAPGMELCTLEVREDPDTWQICDANGLIKACLSKFREPAVGWSELIQPSFDTLRGWIAPSETEISFSANDQFFPSKVESLPLAFLEVPAEDNGSGSAGTQTISQRSALFSFEASYDEHFAGTGERFTGIDLRGKTFVLENQDGLGVNSRRTYKNVPMYISSRNYGLFMHTGSHARLSLADISTRAAQGRIDDRDIDLFLIGGSTPERILYNYRCVTGFPPQLPAWSYGTWMAKMTYFSTDEITGITDRLRSEKYPCDVIHIDTGWFVKDWVCEWEFGKERFPDPEGFMKRLKDDGFRVSLWQTPNIGEGNKLLQEALDNRYLAPPKGDAITENSDFSGQDFGGQIDFTNPEAEVWYRGKIRALMEMGASVIKTDFGEKVQMDADYLNLPASKLHNLYGLLYQRAAFQETGDSTGEGIIWARAGWAGCQRYPLHWGGDAASSWDGMAASLRGGLHLGLSGFGYWSHDVPGFHGIPEFMNTPPEEELYIRWTQMGVFSSHLRYHGTSDREPWHFPAISDLVRKWLNLRYALIPYLIEQAERTGNSGYPMLRALLLQSPEEPVCWNIDDQFMCGDNLLVCPVIRPGGERNIYLPEGEWIDFWTGEKLTGPRWIMKHQSELARLPVFAVSGTSIPVYPESAQCVDEMDFELVRRVEFDHEYTGITAELPGVELP